MNTTYGYSINTATNTDATVSGSLHSPVKVEIARHAGDGDWFVQETRHFGSLQAALTWADRRIAS
jgi:hypothetical protein